jgi:hypothetical protein
MDSKNISAIVLMPFDKEFDDIYEIGIKETATTLNIIAQRVDDQLFDGRILDRVYEQINSADIVISPPLSVGLDGC